MATSAPTSMAQNTLPGTAAPAAPDSVAPKAAAAGSRKRTFIIGGVLVAVAAGTAYWLHARQFEDTDDAQIDGTISNISPRISGTVTAVYVLENQPVKKGDVIADIDPTDLQIALDQAKAQVAQAQAQLAAEDPNVSITLASNVSAVSGAQSDLAGAQAALAGAKKDVQQLSAQIAEAVANDRQAQIEKERSQRLVAQGAVAQSDYDQHLNAATASAANVEATRQALAAAKDHVAQQEAQITALQSRFTEVKSNAPRQVATRTATLGVRQAALELAQAQLAAGREEPLVREDHRPGHGHRRQEGDRGRRSRRAGPAGRRHRADRRLLRDRQLPRDAARADAPRPAGDDPRRRARRRPARHASRASAARPARASSVLPPENAAGNYVKVVQRIPVRIHIDAGPARRWTGFASA